MKKLHPVTVLLLGATPVLAGSVSLTAALGMCLAVILITFFSTLLLGLIRKLIPAEAKLPAVVLTVAGFASMVQLLLQAILPSAASMLGVYLAVLAVEALLFTSGEEALDEGLGAALLKGECRAVCFAVFTLILAVLRELFGSASFAGTEIAALKAVRIPLLAQPVGGLILFAVLLAVVNRLFPGENVRGELTRAAVGLAPEDKEAEA